MTGIKFYRTAAVNLAGIESALSICRRQTNFGAGLWICRSPKRQRDARIRAKSPRFSDCLASRRPVTHQILHISDRRAISLQTSVSGRRDSLRVCAPRYRSFEKSSPSATFRDS